MNSNSAVLVYKKQTQWTSIVQLPLTISFEFSLLIMDQTLQLYVKLM